MEALIIIGVPIILLLTVPTWSRWVEDVWTIQEKRKEK